MFRLQTVNTKWSTLEASDSDLEKYIPVDIVVVT